MLLKSIYEKLACIWRRNISILTRSLKGNTMYVNYQEKNNNGLIWNKVMDNNDNVCFRCRE